LKLQAAYRGYPDAKTSVKKPSTRGLLKTATL